ncbi:hypothetical protein BC628DRAFT_1535488 [Trametes gibbosa]|nr:hypothetical protein BC628DRAFT_1535488 [Trametes gibbosa]
MVSADNLNFDCLGLIFAFVSGNDMVSVSLVSWSFLTAVTPRLYRTLTFGLHQAKRYPSIMSPFAVVLAHSNLASHVRHIDIRAIPTVKFSHQPKFLDDCSRALAICENLGSFTCTLDVLPSFLPSLLGKESLENLRFIGNLSTDQSYQLAQISGLRELTIDSSTWNVVDVFPKWMEGLGPTLTSLTLYSIHTLSMEMLENILPTLPFLTRLHVVNCTKVDHAAVLRVIQYTPDLESLAFTSFESSRSLPLVIAPLPRLRHLALHTPNIASTVSQPPAFWTTMIDLTRTWSCPLKSLTLRLSDRITLSDFVVANLVDSHYATLTHLAILNCSLSKESVAKICRKCTGLERFALSIPAKDSYEFAQAVAQAKSIHTITEVGGLRSTHSPRPPLSKLDIRMIMTHQPTIENIIADGRVWTVCAISRMRSHHNPNHWYGRSRRCDSQGPEKMKSTSTLRGRIFRLRITGSCRLLRCSNPVYKMEAFT